MFEEPEWEPVGRRLEEIWTTTDLHHGPRRLRCGTGLGGAAWIPWNHIILIELTYLGEPRRTGSETAMQFPRGVESALLIALKIYVQSQIQEAAFKPQVICECKHLISHHLEFISQKADSLYSFVNSHSVRGCWRHIVLLLGC